MHKVTVKYFKFFIFNHVLFISITYVIVRKYTSFTNFRLYICLNKKSSNNIIYSFHEI